MSMYNDYGYENKYDCYTSIAKDYNIDVSFVFNIASRYGEEDPDISDLIDAIQRRLGIKTIKDDY